MKARPIATAAGVVGGVHGRALELFKRLFNLAGSDDENGQASTTPSLFGENVGESAC